MRIPIQKITQYLFRENRMLVFTLATLVVFSVSTYVFAVYNPGDTNDPTCAPGAAGCYVQILPDQTSNSGKFLTTNGTTASWGTVTSNTFSTGLTNTSGTVTNNLLTGVSGGQTAIGGTQKNDSLIFQASSSSTARDNTISAFIFNSAGSFGGTGDQVFSTFAPTINQGAAAGYTALKISATETATGSGSKYLINALAGVSGTTSEFSVSNTGVVTTAADAVINGASLGLGVVSGANDMVFGVSAGAALTPITTNSVFIGYQAGKSQTGGFQDTYLGAGAGQSIVGGDDNVGIGKSAMGSAGGSPSYNTAVGSSALLSVNGNGNSAFGRNTGSSIGVGAYNTLIGAGITGLGTGNSNLILSVSPDGGVTYGGNGVVTGSYNTYIGGAVGTNTSNTVSLSDGQGNIVLYSPSTHNVIFGGSTTDATAGLVQIAKDFSGTPSTINGAYFNSVGGTFTDNNTLASGTAAGMLFNSFGQPTLVATNPGVVTTNAYNLYIAGAPKPSTSEFLTNSTALNIAAGVVSGGGGTTNSYGLRVNAQTGGTNNYSAVFLGGNVAIGNSAPAGLFSVGGASEFQINSVGAITATTGITSSGTYSQSAGTFSLTSASTTGTTTSSAAAFNLNSLTTGTGLYGASSTLTSGKLLDLQISGTAAAASQTGLNILMTGSNATSGITTYGAQISNTHSTASPSSTNVALYLNASGGATANYGLIVNSGNVGIGTTAPGAPLEVVGNILSKGTSWSSQTSPSVRTWQSVTYGNGMYVAVASDGTTGNDIMTSPDGVNWTSRTSPNAQQWESVTYGNGMFVAVAQNGTTSNDVMYSSNGTTWSSTGISVPNPQAWQAVAYGNGKFVAVANNGTTSQQIMTSSDGITWAAATSASQRTWHGLTYGNGYWVAVATDGTTSQQIMTATDPTGTWLSRTSSVASPWQSVTYGNGLFVAVASSSATRAMTASDPTGTWLSRTIPQNGWWSVTYGNGLFVAVSADIGWPETSPDGITWTARTYTQSQTFQSVTYGNGMFVTVASDGAASAQVETSGYNDYISNQNNNQYNGGMTLTGLGVNNGAAGVCISAAGVLTSASSTCTTVSALRFKHDISDLTGNLDKVLALRPVAYTANSDNSKNIGFVAEEVVPIENRLVDYDANGQVMGLNYAQFAPLFAGAIADLNKKLTDVDPTHDGSLASLVATYLENAFVKIGNLTVGSSAKPAGITLYDTSTKQPYCLTITNGVPVSTQGECPVVSVDTPATSSSTTLPTSQTPSPDSSSSASLGSSAGDSTTPLTPSDSTAVPTDTTTPAS